MYPLLNSQLFPKLMSSVKVKVDMFEAGHKPNLFWLGSGYYEMCHVYAHSRCLLCGRSKFLTDIQRAGSKSADRANNNVR